MTTLLDPVVRPSTAPSQRLRTTMAAVRVSLSWLGTRKTLTAEQKTVAADAFGAEGAFLSAGKKLLDNKQNLFCVDMLALYPTRRGVDGHKSCKPKTTTATITITTQQATF